MKRSITVLCALALFQAAFAQDSTSKPSAVLNEREAPRHHQSLETRATAARLLPTGTAIRIRLERPLSTRRNHTGDTFYGHITDPVSVGDRILIPAGSTVTGLVDRLSQPRRFAGHPSLRLRPEKMTLPNGDSYAIDATVVDSGDPRRIKVNEEGRISGPAVSTGDKIESRGAHRHWRSRRSRRGRTSRDCSWEPLPERPPPPATTWSSGTPWNCRQARF